MNKINSYQSLLELRNNLLKKNENISNGGSADKVIIKVSMSTCGIASGAKETMEHFKNELEHNAIDAGLIKTGCMGYCYAEPTVEVKKPGEEAVIFGYVDAGKVEEIINNFILKGLPVDGVIERNFQTAH